MTPPDDIANGPFGPISRRSAIGSALLAGAAFLAPPAFAAEDARAPAACRSGAAEALRHEEVDQPLGVSLSPEDDARAVPAAGQGRGLRRHRAELRPRVRPVAEGRHRASFREIRRAADQIGIAISGLCSFLFWPYPLTSNDESKRSRGLELAGPHGAGGPRPRARRTCWSCRERCTFPWRDDHEPVPNDVCDRRAREAVGTLVKTAEKLKVYLNIENIFFNGYLLSPMEMNAFVDSFNSPHVRVHFDTGQHHALPASRALDSDPRAADPQHRTSRNSRRRAPTTRWSRSGRCWTGRRTGRR